MDASPPPSESRGPVGWRSFRCRSQDGLSLHARDWGERHWTALPVVCLPGLTRNAADFDELAAALHAGTRRVLALDYRGRGQSDRDPDWKNYDIQVEAQDVLAVLTAAGIQEAIVIGTSRGGLIAMAMAAIRPAVLRGVVLNDIGPVIDGKGLARIRSYVGKLPRPKTYAEAVDVLRTLANQQFTALSDADWLAQARRTWKETADGLEPDYDVAIQRGLDAIDIERPLIPLWGLFEGLSGLPVLAIRGENSDLLSPDTLAEMGRRHPRLMPLTVPGQGHAPLLSDPPTIAAIAAFVAELVP